MQTATEFWNDLFAKPSDPRAGQTKVDVPDVNDPVLRRALLHFGELRGKTVVDLGCGRGAASLFFAANGANVVSVDLSEVAIDNLAEYCSLHRIENVRPIRMSALEIDRLRGAQFVFGSMILHHLEPFADFARRLRTALDRGGRAFFWENNATSELIVWFRNHVVGKLWVPKHGDRDEFPLTPAEVEELRRHFEVRIEYPELLLFRMIPLYLLRGRLMAPFEALDDIGYRSEWLRRRSYRQYLCLA